MEYKFRRHSGWNFPLSYRMANRSLNPPERENLVVKDALLDLEIRSIIREDTAALENRPGQNPSRQPLQLVLNRNKRRQV